MGQPLVHTLRVRYGESDLQGIVFNAHYLNYFDTSMTELWRAAYGRYQAMLDRGIDIVLAEAQLRFRKPARFDDELELSVAVSHTGNTSIVTRHFARCGGDVVAEGDLRHVLVDLRTLAKTPIPDWAREGLQPWYVAEADAPPEEAPPEEALPEEAPQ
jgi:acyl-CoA thioester hydrolase